MNKTLLERGLGQVNRFSVRNYVYIGNQNLHIRLSGMLNRIL